MKTAAMVRLKVDGLGKGEVVINGIHMEKVIAGLRLFVSEERTMLQIDIHAELMEMEGSGIPTLIRELTPETTVPQHDLIQPKVMGPRICSVCRQVVGNPKWNPDVCPGPMVKP